MIKNALALNTKGKGKGAMWGVLMKHLTLITSKVYEHDDPKKIANLALGVSLAAAQPKVLKPNISLENCPS